VGAPRVTVVIPTHNRARLLREAVGSVLAQTYTDFRLVVADNASTDETPELVAGYEDERVTHLRRPENVGLLENFQDSLRRVESEYALIVCDDDLLRPDFLAATVDVLDRQPRAGLVHTAFDVVDGDGRVVEHATDWTHGLTADAVETGPQFLAESMRWGCRVCSSAALMRTAALPPTLFERDDMPAIDFGLWLRLALDWDVAYLARPLAAYRIHGASESAGLGAPFDAGYRTGVEWIDRRAGVKERFLAEHGHRLSNVEELHRIARRGRRYELVAMARKATLPERRPVATLRSLARAARADPAVAADPAAWRLAAASVLGPRLVERLRGRA
jgi:glycosyltransferase involved in cell wall biosynthesis